MGNIGITIADINSDLKGYMKYALHQNVDDDLKRLSLNERIAIITHYLHNQGTEFGKPYEKMAIKLMDDLYHWKMETANKR